MVDLAAHGQALQHILGDLSTLVVRDLVSLFSQHGHGEGFPELLRHTFGEIVRPYAHAAGTITAQWYNELNHESDYNATPVVDLPDARLDKTIGWALHARTEQRVPDDFVPRDSVDVRTPVPLDVTLSRLAGSSKRMVADASRTTVVDNAAREDVRWARLAAADACEFCRLMATRGAVYRGYGIKTEDPGFAAQKVRRLVVVGRNGRTRGKRQIGESYHDHCRCVAVPVRAGTQWNPPEYTAGWSDEYREAVNRAGGSSDFKKILAEMRAMAREQNATPDAERDDHVHLPVELDEPTHV